MSPHVSFHLLQESAQVLRRFVTVPVEHLQLGLHFTSLDLDVFDLDTHLQVEILCVFHQGSRSAASLMAAHFLC